MIIYCYNESNKDFLTAFIVTTATMEEATLPFLKTFEHHCKCLLASINSPLYEKTTIGLQNMKFNPIHKRTTRLFFLLEFLLGSKK
ncbi:hypothetical protein HNY73_012211 [Argiope bruennichi]|uniref:Uncharacterized protein n=1 Tax=Argiope bruennichi TaxID=94029 RepID=A0A8T0EW96_ARGBR|nr:hypothetical protein HNY73_012211 [Argiope bruennichi]